MAYNRRNFLKATGMLAGGLLTGAHAVKALAANNFDDDMPRKALEKFGLQLYSVRDDLPKDPKAVLKQVAAFGYKQVESFEGSKGMFWGMTNKEFKKYMDDLGMSIISSHCDINKDFDKKAAEAGEIGMKYLICPWVGPQKTIDDYKKIAEKFNASGEICKKNGIRFGYHNHWYSFQLADGVFPQDVMMQNTDANLVDFEMDIYWVVTPGADPIAWIKKYPKRFRLCHIKDRSKTAGPKDLDASVDLGTGSIDFSKIIDVASKNGMEYYIVEQEKYDNTTPLKSAEVDAAYLKKLKY